MKLEHAARTAPQISLLVPTHGRPDRVTALLARLQEQSVPSDLFELILVDDGGDPPVAIDVRELPFACSVIHRPNGGPAAARNTGLALVKAPLVLILNDDAVPAHDLIEQHLAAHAKADGKTAILGTFHFTEAALASPFVQVLDQTNRLFAFETLVHGQKYPWTYFWTCNISLPTDAFFEVGGFDDENFDKAICEDTELGFRLEQAGWSIEYDETCVAHHDHALSPRSYMERGVSLGIYQRRMHMKHPSVDFGMARWPHDEFILEQRVLKLIEERLPAADALLERLEALEQTHRGVKLTPAVVETLDEAISLNIMVHWLAGVYEEITGYNPLHSVRSAQQESQSPENLTGVLHGQRVAAPSTAPVPQKSKLPEMVV